MLLTSVINHRPISFRVLYMRRSLGIDGEERDHSAPCRQGPQIVGSCVYWQYYVPHMVAVMCSRAASATFAAPGTQGRRQSHAKREGRRWGNMNGAHWEDGAAARRTCSTWPFGFVHGAQSCVSASPPPPAPTPAPARRTTPRRLPRRAAVEPPCRRLLAGSRARVAAAAARESGCGRWGRGCWAAPACAGGSGARARILRPTSGGAGGGAGHRGPRDKMPIAACAQAPSSHRSLLAARGPNAPSGTNDLVLSYLEKQDPRKRGKNASRTCLGRDGLRAPTWCGRSARRRPPECRGPSPPDAARRAPVFTLVPDHTKNAYKYSSTSHGNVDVTSHSNVVHSVFARLRVFGLPF